MYLMLIQENIIFFNAFVFITILQWIELSFCFMCPPMHFPAGLSLASAFAIGPI